MRFQDIILIYIDFVFVILSTIFLYITNSKSPQILIIQGRIKMENKHIQNNRNENNKKNDTAKNTEKIYIQENEYVKNQNNFHKRGELSEENYAHKSEEQEAGRHTHELGATSAHQHTNESGEASVYQHTHTHVDANGNVYTHTHTHSPKIVKNELNRIARIIGHMKSIKIMIESGRDCSEVLIQLAAVDAAVKSLSRVILKEHMSTCIVDAIKTGDEEAIEALNDAIDKFMK